ncbi:MAG: O-antigen ligase family protein, partial [Planctomycetes bacterium]|nr:O-antigen ligase family protein [Planctomycetota bacterium]
MVFFVTVNVVRTPWQALALALAVTSVGALEGLYGFVKLLSGKQRWPLTGTFVNKNHFCGLLEMSLFVTLGLALSLAAPAHRLGSLRARLMARFSSAGTHQVLILCALAMVIGLAILFSLSRAGIACAFVSLIGFAIALGLSAGFRRHILLLSLVGMAVLLMATLAGTGVVAEKMGEALPGRTLSWTDRLALSRSGVAHFQSFPVFGTGLGSFRFAFERFQSSRFGDRMVDYLHNDWIQVFCETGAVGGSLVAMGLLVFLWGTARTAASRRDRLCRWLSVGALAGVSSMLLHSLFDFNLTKITCNGILFALIAGLGFAAARMPSGEPGSEDRRKLLTISLGPPLVRMLLAIVVTGAGALSLAWPVRSGLAHYYLNEFLAGSKLWEVDRYFVPVPKWTPNATTEALLFQAQEWDDGNPQGHWFGAHFYAAKANELTRRTAKEAARRILGPESVVANAQAYEELVDVLARNLATQPSRSRARLLGESERMARLSMQRAPISSEHQLYIGWLLSTRAKAESLPEDEAAEMRREAMAHAERAVWLSPAKPHILYHA